jgi:hypothetical protein
MKNAYQVIRLLKLQILSSISNNASVKTPGFPLFLALIMLLVMPLVIPQENGILLVPATFFESTNDSFRVQLPEGWVIQDVNNTGSTLAAEVTEGYGILAQICPGEEEEGQQQQGGGEAIINVSTSTGSCQQQQQSQEEIIHIIRYPNLGARLGIALADISDSIPYSVLAYQVLKLEEVGYRLTGIVNSGETKIIVYDPGESRILATAPARMVVVTYSTDSAPSETRIGYIILTATNAPPPNLQTITGYSIFYEGALGATTVRAEEITRSEGLPPVSTEVTQILNSFGLIPSEETVQFVIDARARQATVGDQADDAGEEEEEASQPASATQYLDTTTIMLIVYSLLVVGVVWKFVSYIREKNHRSRLNEIS